MALMTITDAYNHFEILHGNERPERTADELRALIHACDLRYEDIDSRFWNAVFDSEWYAAESADGREFDDAVELFKATPAPEGLDEPSR